MPCRCGHAILLSSHRIAPKFGSGACRWMKSMHGLEHLRQQTKYSQLHRDSHGLHKTLSSRRLMCVHTLWYFISLVLFLQSIVVSEVSNSTPRETRIKPLLCFLCVGERGAAVQPSSCFCCCAAPDKGEHQRVAWAGGLLINMAMSQSDLRSGLPHSDTLPLCRCLFDHVTLWR